MTPPEERLSRWPAALPCGSFRCHPSGDAHADVEFCVRWWVWWWTHHMRVSPTDTVETAAPCSTPYWQTVSPGGRLTRRCSINRQTRPPTGIENLLHKPSTAPSSFSLVAGVGNEAQKGSTVPVSWAHTTGPSDCASFRLGGSRVQLAIHAVLARASHFSWGQPSSYRSLSRRQSTADCQTTYSCRSTAMSATTMTFIKRGSTISVAPHQTTSGTAIPSDESHMKVLSEPSTCRRD